MSDSRRSTGLPAHTDRAARWSGPGADWRTAPSARLPLSGARVFAGSLGLCLLFAGAVLGLAHGAWLPAVATLALGAGVLHASFPWVREGEEPRGEQDVMVTAAGDGRVRCPCCACPTLRPDEPDQSCILCEWLVDGLPSTGGEGAEITSARESFRRHLSAYPPDGRPDWSPDPPSEEELDLKRELVTRYAELLAQSGDARVLWSEVESLERELEELEREYSLSVAGAAAEELLAADDDQAMEDDMWSEDQREEALRQYERIGIKPGEHLPVPSFDHAEQYLEMLRRVPTGSGLEGVIRALEVTKA